MVRLLNLLRPATQGARILGATVLMAFVAHAQTLNTLYTFSHGDLGHQPAGGVTIGPNGELYGTTEHGGKLGYGVVYELVPPGSAGGAWTEVMLHTFTDQDGPQYSGTGVALGPNGALYGVSGDPGVTFRLKPPTASNTEWREVILHAFTATNGDGGRPSSTPVIGPKGVLYGDTLSGGQYNNGAIYSLTPTGTAGAAWNEQILHSFQLVVGDGGGPAGALALAADGTIYGTTSVSAGPYYSGTAFALTPPAKTGGAWTETQIYIFGSQPGDVGAPAGVTMAPNGLLYGSTNAFSGRPPCSGNCGTVFQLSPPSIPGGPWTETVLHTFNNLTGDLWSSLSTPVIGPNGVLYGAAWGGGAFGKGGIFQLAPPSSPGGTWTETILYSFTGGADGWASNSVTLGSDGNLYGTTYQGGVSPGGATNQGTVFQLVLH